MYAIVKTGGKQYKVSKGLIFETELLDAEVNLLEVGKQVTNRQ